MAIPFTVDISAFYGEPDFREHLNLHKELEAPTNTQATKKRPSPKRTKKSAGAIGFKDTGGAVGFNTGGACKTTGGAVGFNTGGACKTTGGAVGFKDTGGALWWRLGIQ